MSKTEEAKQRERVRPAGMRVRTFCEAFDVSPATAYKMMADGRLPYVYIGGRRFIDNDTAEKLRRDGE